MVKVKMMTLKLLLVLEHVLSLSTIVSSGIEWNVNDPALSFNQRFGLLEEAINNTWSGMTEQHALRNRFQVLISIANVSPFQLHFVQSINLRDSEKTQFEPASVIDPGHAALFIVVAKQSTVPQKMIVGAVVYQIVDRLSQEINC